MAGIGRLRLGAEHEIHVLLGRLKFLSAFRDPDRGLDDVSALLGNGPSEWRAAIDRSLRAVRGPARHDDVTLRKQLRELLAMALLQLAVMARGMRLAASVSQ
jgi:hypothetical protein